MPDIEIPVAVSVTPSSLRGASFSRWTVALSNVIKGPPFDNGTNFSGFLSYDEVNTYVSGDGVNLILDPIQGDRFQIPITGNVVVPPTPDGYSLTSVRAVLSRTINVTDAEDAHLAAVNTSTVEYAGFSVLAHNLENSFQIATGESDFLYVDAEIPPRLTGNGHLAFGNVLTGDANHPQGWSADGTRVLVNSPLNVSFQLPNPPDSATPRTLVLNGSIRVPALRHVPDEPIGHLYDYTPKIRFLRGDIVAGSVPYSAVHNGRVSRHVTETLTGNVGDPPGFDYAAAKASFNAFPTSGFLVVGNASAIYSIDDLTFIFHYHRDEGPPPPPPDETKNHVKTAREIWKLRDYTQRMFIFTSKETVLGNGTLRPDLICKIYNDVDAVPIDVNIESGARRPNFHLHGDYIEGTYMTGVARHALSYTHGREWILETIPGGFDNVTSTIHNSRLVVAGFVADIDPVSHAKLDTGKWYAIVGTLNRDGTYTWGTAKEMIISFPTYQGHISTRDDGILEFAYIDSGKVVRVVRCYGLDRNGVGDWV